MNLNHISHDKEIGNLKTFLIKYSLVGGVIMWTVNSSIKEFLTSFINNTVEPLFSIDLDGDGRPDLQKVKNWKVKVKGATFPVGKILLDLIKTIVTVAIMLVFINYIIKHTFFLEKI